jgi:hypothetical protein
MTDMSKEKQNRFLHLVVAVIVYGIDIASIRLMIQKGLEPIVAKRYRSGCQLNEAFGFGSLAIATPTANRQLVNCCCREFFNFHPTRSA